jgi:uncharacterized protein YutE (UPF0331/DUF86 family)
MNDVILNRKVSMERCIGQARAYYARESDMPFEEDYLRQDAIALNVQRICELAIDIANAWIRKDKLGLPQNSADTFALLHQAGRIPEALATDLRKMVAFRNILVHRYQDLDLELMRAVIEKHLEEPLRFAELALKNSG